MEHVQQVSGSAPPTSLRLVKSVQPEFSKAWEKAPDIAHAGAERWLHRVVAERAATTYDSGVLFDSDGKEITAAREGRIAELQALWDQAISKAEDGDVDAPLYDTIWKGTGADSLAAADQQLLKFMMSSQLETEFGGSMSAAKKTVGDMSTLYYDSDLAFEGEDVVFADGYSVIAQHLVSVDKALNIKLSEKVQTVDATGASVVVTSDKGQYTANRVIVAVPLGVLKAGHIEFKPALPDTHGSAISQLKMGLLNKLYLRFDSVFWDDYDWIESIPAEGAAFQTWTEWVNLNRPLKQPILLGFSAADGALSLEGSAGSAPFRCGVSQHAPRAPNGLKPVRCSRFIYPGRGRLASPLAQAKPGQFTPWSRARFAIPLEHRSGNPIGALVDDVGHAPSAKRRPNCSSIEQLVQSVGKLVEAARIDCSIGVDCSIAFHEKLRKHLDSRRPRSLARPVPPCLGVTIRSSRTSNDQATVTDTAGYRTTERNTTMSTMMRLALLSAMLVTASACTGESYDEEDVEDMEEEPSSEATAAGSHVYAPEQESNNSHLLANPIPQGVIGMKGSLAPPPGTFNDYDWFSWKIPSNAKHCFKVIRQKSPEGVVIGDAVMDISHATGDFGKGLVSKCVSNKKDLKISILVRSPKNGGPAQTYKLLITTP